MQDLIRRDAQRRAVSCEQVLNTVSFPAPAVFSMEQDGSLTIARSTSRNRDIGDLGQAIPVGVNRLKDTGRRRKSPQTGFLELRANSNVTGYGRAIGIKSGHIERNRIPIACAAGNN